MPPQILVAQEANIFPQKVLYFFVPLHAQAFWVVIGVKHSQNALKTILSEFVCIHPFSETYLWL